MLHGSVQHRQTVDGGEGKQRPISPSTLSRSGGVPDGDVPGHRRVDGTCRRCRAPAERGESPHPHVSPAFTGFILENGARGRRGSIAGSAAASHRRPRHACSECLWSSWGPRLPGTVGDELHGRTRDPPGVGAGKGPAPTGRGAGGTHSAPLTAAREHWGGGLSACPPAQGQTGEVRQRQPDLLTPNTGFPDARREHAREAAFVLRSPSFKNVTLK